MNKHPKRCPILTNHSTTKEGKCKRLDLCTHRETDRDRCPATGRIRHKLPVRPRKGRKIDDLAMLGALHDLGKKKT